MKNKLRREQAARYAANCMWRSVAGVYRLTLTYPGFIAGAMMVAAVSASVARTAHIPTKIFRADQPKVDPRRAKRARRHYLRKLKETRL